jgi:thiol-disulfide isomerase/thioredoxin
MKNIVFLLIFINSILVCGQKKLSQDDPSPFINITDWIANTPSNKDLKNKYIVLEFWATWCAPCLKYVPHLNYLKEKFKNEEDLLFLSITNEEVGKVKKILKYKNFQTTVVTDTTNQTLKNFNNYNDGIIELPLTVLINKENKIFWVGKPSELSEELILSFLRNDEIIDTKQNINENLPVNYKGSFRKFLEVAKSNEIDYYFELAESKFCNSFVHSKVNKNLFYLESESLRSILTNLLDYNVNLISINDPVLEKKGYTILYKNSNSNIKKEKKEQLIFDSLQIDKTSQKRNIQSNKLFISNIDLLEKKSTNKSSQVQLEDTVILFNYNFKMLSEFFEREFIKFISL